MGGGVCRVTDGVLRSAAELSGCNYLLTRDAPGFLAASFEKVDVDGLLEVPP